MYSGACGIFGQLFNFLDFKNIERMEDNSLSLETRGCCKIDFIADFVFDCDKEFC